MELLFEINPKSVKKIPHFLKEQRKKSGKNQQTIGKKVGITQVMVSGMENKPLKGKTLEYLTRYLNALDLKLCIVRNDDTSIADNIPTP